MGDPGEEQQLLFSGVRYKPRMASDAAPLAVPGLRGRILAGTARSWDGAGKSQSRERLVLVVGVEYAYGLLWYGELAADGPMSVYEGHVGDNSAAQRDPGTPQQGIMPDSCDDGLDDAKPRDAGQQHQG